MLRRSIQQHKKFSVTAAKAAGKKFNAYILDNLSNVKKNFSRGIFM